MPNTRHQSFALHGVPWLRGDEFVFSNELEASWLQERGSLTARLRAHCPELAVSLQHQGAQQNTWLRHVHLHCKQHIWIDALTVIDHFNPDNPWYALHQLGQRPLGEYLFNHPNLERSEFTFYRQHGQPLRRCIFTKQEARLLLIEKFLYLPPQRHA